MPQRTQYQYCLAKRAIPVCHDLKLRCLRTHSFERRRTRKSGKIILKEFLGLLFFWQKIDGFAIQGASEANQFEIRDPTNLGLYLCQCFSAQIPTPPGTPRGKLGLGQPGLIPQPANSRTDDIAGIAHRMFGIWNLKLTATGLKRFGIQNGRPHRAFSAWAAIKFEISSFQHPCVCFFLVAISQEPLCADASMTRGTISRHIARKPRSLILLTA